MASALGLVGRAGSMAYIASKGAVVQMTKVVCVPTPRHHAMYADGLDRLHWNMVLRGL